MKGKRIKKKDERVAEEDLKIQDQRGSYLTPDFNPDDSQKVIMMVINGKALTL
jgi:hypothetical protein